MLYSGAHTKVVGLCRDIVDDEINLRWYTRTPLPARPRVDEKPKA
jgi:hypothetical protein